ncbi:S-layer homology domain-containing protein [Paenibacillus sp. OV219]|uniref:S-layer homology domain-containing protein n=1 Tax=Paenibacillus sp. OV219 TaxID=1884377 RepID=UPI0008BA4CD3|nr:S-layer homology domain-containing protein [Paenibacillus sp. OV219]SEN76049.1 S-layer homology domain-containing protein [Paenibacillus sp. OV219]
MKRVKNLSLGFACLAVISIPVAAEVQPIEAVAAGIAGITITTFKDVPSNHWAKDAIKYVGEKGYMAGYAGNLFLPSETITRAEFAAVIVRISGLKAAKSGMFSDISEHWASGAIQSAAAAGIVTKAEYGSAFHPNQAITRLEMARMIARALAKVPAYSVYLRAFGGLYNADLPLVDYREMKKADVPYLAITFGSRIMTGYADASFGLYKQATRAEAAAMFQTLSGVRGKKPESYPYLIELKEVAETGMNAEAVSKLIPQVNIVKDKPIVIEHANFTAKLKRVYVVPIKGATKSMYERKYIWDRAIYPKGYLEQASGFAVAVADVTFKKSGDRTLYSQNLFMTPASAFFYQEPYEHYGFVFPYMKPLYLVEKGKTVEVTLYGGYGALANFHSVAFNANNAKSSGWHTILMEPIGK